MICFCRYLSESGDTTGELAKLLSVHPNTIRWYENHGHISPAARSVGVYRLFEDRHLIQLKICRLIFGGVYTKQSIRDRAFAVLAAVRDGDASLAKARLGEAACHTTMLGTTTRVSAQPPRER
jgi:hypothetical protein